MTPPLISVIMVNRDGLPWLIEAVDSVLKQDYANIELIVADGGSTDGSIEVLRDYAAKDARVRIIEEGQARGISRARNSGVDAAQGEFIAVLDSDDIFLRHTLTTAFTKFQELRATHPDLCLLTSDAWLISEKGRRRGRYMPTPFWNVTLFQDTPSFALPSTFFFSTQSKLRFCDDYRAADGVIFLYRAHQAGTVAFWGEPTIDYRVRKSSGSSATAACLLREMEATERSRADGRLANPYLPTEVPETDPQTVRLWQYGRIAKANFINEDWLKAVFYLAASFLISPKAVVTKVRAFGRRWV